MDFVFRVPLLVKKRGESAEKHKMSFFRGLLAPWGFREHPKTHTFLESTCPEVNETAIKISNFGRYPQFRRPSNFGPPLWGNSDPHWRARVGRKTDTRETDQRDQRERGEDCLSERTTCTVSNRSSPFQSPYRRVLLAAAHETLEALRGV